MPLQSLTLFTTGPSVTLPGCNRLAASPICSISRRGSHAYSLCNFRATNPRNLECNGCHMVGALNRWVVKRRPLREISKPAKRKWPLPAEGKWSSPTMKDSPPIWGQCIIARDRHVHRQIQISWPTVCPPSTFSDRLTPIQRWTACGRQFNKLVWSHVHSSLPSTQPRHNHSCDMKAVQWAHPWYGQVTGATGWLMWSWL